MKTTRQMVALDVENYEPADIDTLPYHERGAERLTSFLRVSGSLRGLDAERFCERLHGEVLERLPHGTVQYALVEEALRRLLPPE